MNDYFVNTEAGRRMQALKPIALPSDIGEVAPFSPRPPPAGSPTIRSGIEAVAATRETESREADKHSFAHRRKQTSLNNNSGRF
jgi:hypothetical protein